MKTTTTNGVYWRCSVRSKANRCPATVIKKGYNFKSGSSDHNHAGVPSALLHTKVRVDVKTKAKEDTESSASALAEEIIQDHRVAQPLNHSFPTITNEARVLNRVSASYKPPEPTSRDFELDLQSVNVPEEFLKADIKTETARHLVFA